MAEGSLVPNSRKKHPDFSIAYGDWLDAINTSLTHARTPELNSFTTRAERTHKLRAALKNTRALLRLAPPTDRRKARRFRRQLALIADSLAKDRDRHVLRETLENLNLEYAIAKLRGVPQQAAIMPKMIEAKRAVKLIERAQQKQAHLRQKISDCLGTLP